MNKKLLWTLVLPAALASCNQDDLLSEGISNTPEGKAISGVTFTIAKNGSEAGTRAAWVDNKLSFEKGDLISLFWLGEDGYTQNNTTGEFTYASPASDLTDGTPVVGKSNAIFRTEDGSNFSAEAVVYEGYNLLVYPGNTSHVDPKDVEVSLPGTQKAAEDFTTNVVYIGDSILHIHQPALKASDKKYYDFYGAVATTDDPNTSGYAHGIKTGVKLLSSLLNLKFRIINSSASDVEIQKVELTTTGPNSIFAVKGNLVPGATDVTKVGQPYLPAQTKFRNPWFEASEKVDKVTLDLEGVKTVKDGTNVTMLLLPADVTTNLSTAGYQPVLKVYTNYGTVTIGGAVASGDAHSNCIFKADGVEYAANDDNEALRNIVENTANYMDAVEMSSLDNNKAYYKFNSGVSMTRVINVDMQKADIQDQVVSNTEELNAILNAAVQSSKTYATGEELNVVLKADKDGNFELTNYDGLNAFVQKFGANALTLGLDGNTSKNVINVIVNTTEATELQNIEGLPATVALTIPATSKISKVKNGTTAAYTITNPIINQSVITVPAKAAITLQKNAKGTVHYTAGALINVDALNAATYGVIDYTANSKASLDAALAAGVNYVTLKDITSGFFGGSVDASSAKAKDKGASVTVTFDNCGNLNQNIASVKADVVILTNGTSYPDLKNATVGKIIVESETAVLGMSGNTAKDMSATKIVVKAGTTTIDNLALGTLEVAAGATVNVGTKAVAPAHFYVYGTASFAGKAFSANTKVYVWNTQGKISTINVSGEQCLVTGSLELKSDLAYEMVAVSETTAITVAEGVTGLGYKSSVYVTKDAQAQGTANLKFLEVAGATVSKLSWNGNWSDLGWTY